MGNLLEKTDMQKDLAKVPKHQHIYDTIRQRILFGALAPGQSVTIQGLVDELGAGMTPVREALRRLTAEGALTFLGNRRISVPQISAEEFDDICDLRMAIEPKLAQRASGNINGDALKSLHFVNEQMNEAIHNGDNRGYLQFNYQFHFLLYEAAHSEMLYDLAHSLWLRVGPSLRIIAGRNGTANLPDHHFHVLEGLEAGDALKVYGAVAKDISQGFEQIRSDIAKLR